MSDTAIKLSLYVHEHNSPGAVRLRTCSLHDWEEWITLHEFTTTLAFAEMIRLIEMVNVTYN